MKMNIKYRYNESYLPTKRHRKLRYREVEEEMEININEVSEKEAPVAFKVTEYFGTIDYRYYDNQLWTKLRLNRFRPDSDKENLIPLEDLKKYIRGDYSFYNNDHTKEYVQKSYLKDASRYMIIDGVIYERTGEPRYVSMTFGLGHNHGGTALMIDNFYNSNISKDCYFNALQRDEAIKFTKERAIRRGDTNYIDGIENSANIEVLITEAVKCNPQSEHGEGDPFLNGLYAVTENSSSTTEAALLAIAFTSKKINEES